MKRKVFVILTAAGKGDRFSAGSKKRTPKQFTTLLNKPVILHSLSKFQKSKFVDEILISAEKEYFDYLHLLAAANNITKLSRLVEGGKTRFESVKNAFKEISCNKNDLILIHDAARPNISAEALNDIIKESMKAGEVIFASKAADTLKRGEKGFVKETLSRENLWLVQTPQIFRYGVLEDSYRRSRKKTDFTDESGMVEKAGYRVKILEGNRENLKITTHKDITLLKKIMK